jgi:dTDP-4-dehydrorhamnose 3,5-epimerase
MSQITQFDIQGPILLKLNKYADNRGFFTERYKDEYKKLLGIQTNFVQDNFSRSVKSVVRGLHMQHSPGQGKIVTCLSGEILDVIVDVRRNSSTYGKHISVSLKGDEPALFWVPGGFAHGFSVQSESADVLYKVDCLYNAANEVSIKWNDVDIAIDWKVSNPVVSDKDNASPSFKAYSEKPAFL